MRDTITLSALDIRQLAGRPAWTRQWRLLLRHALELAVLGYVLLGLCATLHGPLSESGLWNFIRSPRPSASWQARWGLPALVALSIFAGYALRRPARALFTLFEKLLEHPFYLLGAFLAVTGILYDLYIWSQALNLRLPPWLRAGGILGSNDAIAFDFAAAPILMVMLVSARFFKRPAPLALFLFTLFSGAFGLIFYYKSWPVIVEIMRSLNESNAVTHITQRPGIMVSVYFMPLDSALRVLVPLLAAFYAVRRGFTWWKYFLGWAAGFFFAHLILLQSLPLLIDIRFVLLGWLWLALLARLPLTRRNLEALLGLPLCAEEAPVAMTPSSTFASVVGHATAFVLGLLLVVFAVVGYYERKMIDLFEHGPVPPRYSPALVNAYDALKTSFSKDQSPYLAPMRYGEPAEFALLESMAELPRPFFDEVWAAVDIPALERQLAPLQPGFDAFARAAGADYCLFHDGRRTVIPHFVNLRQVSRGLMIRANLRLRQGRPAEALQDIETILRVAGLFNTDPCGTLVEHMIAGAIRGLGLAAAQQYYLYCRQDPAALEPLRAMLERNARWVRLDFPGEIIARNEPGFWPVVPCFEIAVPGLVKAGTVYYGRWMQYDFLLLSIALEAYKRDHDAYPATLEALAPAYLARLPRDPVQGQPYVYENQGSEFTLHAAPLPTGQAGKVEKEWRYSSSPDTRVRRTLFERYKSNKSHHLNTAVTPTKPA